jgi:4-hydroxybenzoate polyprenyltransferase
VLTLLRRLWQPHRPLFWLWIAFNVLSSAFGWAMRWPGLGAAGVALFGALALANLAASLVLLWRLVARAPDQP